MLQEASPAAFRAFASPCMDAGFRHLQAFLRLHEVIWTYCIHVIGILRLLTPYFEKVDNFSEENGTATSPYRLQTQDTSQQERRI